MHGAVLSGTAYKASLYTLKPNSRGLDQTGLTCIRSVLKRNLLHYV